MKTCDICKKKAPGVIPYEVCEGCSTLAYENNSRGLLIDEILKEMEEFRLRHEYDNPPEPTDYCIRVCQAIIAERGGYPDRASWNHIGQQIKGGLSNETINRKI